MTSSHASYTPTERCSVLLNVSVFVLSHCDVNVKLSLANCVVRVHYLERLVCCVL